MALQAKTIKSKIKAVGNVKKITKAMEKVAAVKMRRVVARTIASREYVFHTYELLCNLLNHAHLKHTFFEYGKGKKILIIAISTNRGLCGNLNSQLSKAVSNYISKNQNEEFDVISVGRKMEKMARDRKLNLIASFTEIPDHVSKRDILPIVKIIKDEFRGNKYKKIVVSYNHFASGLSFDPIVSELLPFSILEIEEVIKKTFKNKKRRDGKKFIEYTFEPSDEDIVNAVLPRILEIKIYKMLLETQACEQSARMMAMKNATENAEGLIDDLVVGYNRARQDGITQEISEISAGAVALEY